MKFKPLRQPDSNACGPTSIKIIIDYFGLPISLMQIKKLSRYKVLDGMSNSDLLNTLDKLHLQTKALSNVSWNDLLRMNKSENAIIVSWMLHGYIGHFSVVEKVTKDHITLVDPLSGSTIKMQKIKFLRLWFDYDDMWFPKKNTDIQLRWMVVVSKLSISSIT